ncbi:MAG TPA: Spy/CpxP family protein refolding chaperone [Steroidobacteraceae bacterium]|nr:Spy/CpxP family protein refolding chaperone [Steroidobacteraceae bacterium]
MKATVLAVALLWAGGLCAQTPALPPQAAAHLDKIATLLDLTDAQKAQVQAVMQEEHAKMKAMHEQAKASGTKPDWEQMKAMHQQMQQEMVQKLTPVLTPEQLKKFQALQELHSDMMMHGPFGHHGAPPADAPPPPAQN